MKITEMKITEMKLRMNKGIDLVPCVVDDSGMDVHIIGCADQEEAILLASLLWDHLTQAERESRNEFYAGLIQRGEDGVPDLGYGAFFCCDFKDDPDEVKFYDVEVK